MSFVLRRLASRSLAAALVLLVAACAQAPRPTPPQPVPPAPYPPEHPVTPLPPGYNPVPESQRLSTLPGWQTADAFIALEALKATCKYRGGQQYAALCREVAEAEFESPEEIKDWLNARFRVEAIDGTGLLTGYFVPEYEAEYSCGGEFTQPVRTRPADLTVISGSQLSPPSSATRVAARREGGVYVPYYTRMEIERGLSDSPYCMRPEDYFFMQIQGSGYLTLPDNRRIYSAYAADNGLPFVGIAKVMVERGILDRDHTSGDNIHRWLAENRGPVAQEVMNTNPRYVFFTFQDDRPEAVGATGLGLPAGSAIAVDPLHNAYGDLFWIDADAGTLKDAFPVYQRMVAALDTGGAIKGRVRADLYLGIGKRAGSEAGRIKHDLRMWRIVPFVP